MLPQYCVLSPVGQYFGPVDLLEKDQHQLLRSPWCDRDLAGKMVRQKDKQKCLKNYSRTASLAKSVYQAFCWGKIRQKSRSLFS